MQPTTLTAYAVPARSGLPSDHRSISMGVRKPTAAQNGTMPATRRIQPGTSTSGSAAASGTSANTPTLSHAKTVVVPRSAGPAAATAR